MIQDVINNLKSPSYLRPYRPLPFWSWNDELNKQNLIRQMEWMHSVGIGGFFMHARGGLITEYLGEEWMRCCDACCDKAAELDMDAYMYDENGWPSGFAGGKLLNDEANRDRYLTYNIGEFDPTATVSYDLGGKALVRVTSGEKDKRYLNVYEHIAVSTVDILNPDVVDKFINLTHAEYKKRYGNDFNKKLKGFFTDEPQYFRWNTSYTPMISKYFREELGKDLLDELGLLFVEKQGYEKFRFEYWSGMRALMLKNFARKLYDYCDSNGMYLTGHYVEESSIGTQMMCCGGVMPFYLFEHMPGIDWLCRALPGELAVKQVGSVAAQTGRDRILTESFGCCGWDVTPRELKKIVDYQYLGGVNVLCHHLLPSSEYGQRKRDYPQHYTPLNPWINLHFKEFNDCYTRLGALIGKSREIADVCVLHPVTSAYIDYKRNEEDMGIGELEKSFHDECEDLGARHVSHHYVDELLLAEMGDARDGKLICGKCEYSYLILPSLKNLNESTFNLINKFVNCGGKLLLLGKQPSYLNGEPHKFDLKSNCTLAEIERSQPYKINNGNLRSCMRTLESGETFIFVINSTDELQQYFVECEGNSVVKLDTETLTASKPQSKSQYLRPGQSAILFPSHDKATEQKIRPVIKPSGEAVVESCTPNVLMLDKVSYSCDGGKYSEPLTLIELNAILLSKRYKGELKIKYDFEAKYVPADLKLYAEDMNTVEVKVNGTALTPQSTLPHEEKVNVYKAAPHCRIGRNEIEITLNYYQDESVYYALFGEGVTESLRNCMVYNTSLESVYLGGSFGVYPVDLQEGNQPETVTCESFIIDKPQKTVTDLITCGYPTFAGSITLRTQVDCPEGGALLQLDGRFQTATVTVNGKSRNMIFDNAVDISDMAKAGKNEVLITITTSLRNVMGPHHFKLCQEPTAVGPEAFTLNGSWHDGKSEWLEPRYALVKTINF